MRSFTPAVYDVSVAIFKCSPQPTMVRLFKGKPSVMHVHLKRHAMKVPETDECHCTMVQRYICRKGTQNSSPIPLVIKSLPHRKSIHRSLELDIIVVPGQRLPSIRRDR